MAKTETKLKRVLFVNGKLACSRCPLAWTVKDLNSERKSVPCPLCGIMNDITAALVRAKT